MGIAGIIELINGILQFPSVILEFIRVLKKTPQQNHEEIIEKVRAEASKFAETGRPSWD